MKKTIAILSLLTILVGASAMDMVATSSMDVKHKGHMVNNNHMMSTSTKKDTVVDSAARWACSATAIDKREAAIIAAADANAVSIKSALTARREGLKALYAAGKTEGSKDTRKAVWSTFSSSMKSAMTDMRTARKSAWSTFETEMKSCGIKDNGEKLEVVSTPAAY